MAAAMKSDDDMDAAADAATDAATGPPWRQHILSWMQLDTSSDQHVGDVLVNAWGATPEKFREAPLQCLPPSFCSQGP
jgi:hypothetical protein